MNRRSKAFRLAFTGLLTALSMIFSYVETLLPFPGIPGAKIGLSNIVTVTGLYTVGVTETIAVSLLRIVLTGFTFGNVSMMIYSFSGWVLSMAAMLIAKKSGLFSVVGVSVSGGVLHNVGQLVCAALVLESPSVFVYLPALLIAGTAAGVVVGIAGAEVAKRIEFLFCK